MEGRFGDEVKSNTEAIVGAAFAREILAVTADVVRPGNRATGEPDLVVEHDPLVGIEVSAAIGDDDYPARLSAWLLANPQSVPVHSSSASIDAPVPVPMGARRASVAREGERITTKHMAQPYANWSHFVINLSHDSVDRTDADWIANAITVPDGCSFLSIHLCYVADRSFVRQFVRVSLKSR